MGNEVNSVGPVETYNILWQHQREENRLLSERTSIFLAASSILFLAFVMMFQESISISGIKWFRIVLPFSGMCITVIFFSLAQGTVKALEFLWDSQEGLEKDFPEFSFMRENGLAPQIEKKARVKRENNLVRFLGKHASGWLIPFTFFSLWVISLIFAIISLAC